MKLPFLFLLLYAGTAMPQSDPHSYSRLKEGSDKIAFRIKNAGFWVDGSLSGLEVSGKFVPDRPAESRLEATLPVKSIDTGIQMRDDHLMREKWFDQENFPLIRLESKTIKRQDDAFLFQGTLTIKGVSKSISFPFHVMEEGGGLRLQGEFALDRQDYEVGSRSLLLGNEVEVNLSCTLLP